MPTADHMENSTTLATVHANISHVSCPEGTSLVTQYVISVTDESNPGGIWTVYRRYSEFREFRQRLLMERERLCPECSTAQRRAQSLKFPRRHLWRSKDEKVVTSRKEHLNAYLSMIIEACRTCRSIECQLRPVLGEFLLVSNMRYTFLRLQVKAPTDKENDPIQTLSAPTMLFHSSGRSFKSKQSVVPSKARGKNRSSGAAHGIGRMNTITEE